MILDPECPLSPSNAYAPVRASANDALGRSAPRPHSGEARVTRATWWDWYAPYIAPRERGARPEEAEAAPNGTWRTPSAWSRTASRCSKTRRERPRVPAGPRSAGSLSTAVSTPCARQAEGRTVASCLLSAGASRRRAAGADQSRIPPPTPRTPLDQCSLTIDGDVDAPRQCAWDDFLALPWHGGWRAVCDTVPAPGARVRH